jgi:hypothetical protein
MHARTYAHTHIRTHAHMHARTYTYTLTHTHTRTHARTHARTHTRTHTHTCTHTHTHRTIVSPFYTQVHPHPRPPPQGSLTANLRHASFGWNIVMPPTALLMLRSGVQRGIHSVVNKYSIYLTSVLAQWTENRMACPRDGSLCYTPAGFAWEAQWGSARQAANMAFIATAYAALIPTKPATRADLCFAHHQSGG